MGQVKSALEAIRGLGNLKTLLILAVVASVKWQGENLSGRTARYMRIEGSASDM